MKLTQDATIGIFFRTEEARNAVILQSGGRVIDGIKGGHGLVLHAPVFHEIFITSPDLTDNLVGWEKGRPSNPELDALFTTWNLDSLRSTSSPLCVLFQADGKDPLNPHGLLMAHMEGSAVKPVASDMDLFLIGLRGVEFEALPEQQADLALWSLRHLGRILENPRARDWNAAWKDVASNFKEEFQQICPVDEMPRYGFGDPTTAGLVEALIDATKGTGAIRHGAECHNFFFPQVSQRA